MQLSCNSHYVYRYTVLCRLSGCNSLATSAEYSGGVFSLVSVGFRAIKPAGDWYHSPRAQGRGIGPDEGLEPSARSTALSRVRVARRHRRRGPRPRTVGDEIEHRALRSTALIAGLRSDRECLTRRWHPETRVVRVVTWDGRSCRRGTSRVRAGRIAQTYSPACFAGWLGLSRSPRRGATGHYRPRIRASTDSGGSCLSLLVPGRCRPARSRSAPVIGTAFGTASSRTCIRGASRA